MNSVGGSEQSSCARHIYRDDKMGNKREKKRLAPIEYEAMVAWLESKESPIEIENLGGRSRHVYGANDGRIVVDGRNIIEKEQWQATCLAMVKEIPNERLDITTEYNKIRNYANPSIPVLCWALCEEIMNGNQVWNKKGGAQ